MKKYLLSIYLILGYFFAHSQPVTNIGWSGPGTAVLNFANACGGFSDLTCLGSGTGSETPFIGGINYTIINDLTATGCSTGQLSDAWLQVWNGDMTSCNTATPVGTPALNTLNVTLTGSGEYFLTVSSMNQNVADNLCGGGKGHDFTGQSASIRYKQETTILNTTNTASHCMNVPKQLTYQLSGTHDNPEVEWEVVAGNGYFIGDEFYASQPGPTTIRAILGVCQSDISFTAIETESAPDTIDAPVKICEGSSFTIEAIGGWTLPTTLFEWGLGDVPGQNILDTTTTPIYNPDPIYQNTTYWVRKIVTDATCGDYTMGRTIEIEVYNDQHEQIYEAICEGDVYMFGNEPITQAVSNYPKVFQTNDLQCDSTVYLNLTVHPAPRALFPRDTTLCHGQSIVLDAGNPGCSYAWSNGAITRTITTNVEGQYHVTITDPLGCQNTDTVDIEMLFLYPNYSMILVKHLDNNHFTFEILDPVDIDDAYWDFGDNSPMKAGLSTHHTYAQDGHYLVTVDMITSCGGLYDEISTHALSINENESKQFKFYPNPTTDYVIIDINNQNAQQVESIRIVDIQGRIVHQAKWRGNQQYRLNLPTLSNGIYQIQLISKEQTVLYQNSLQIIK